MKTLEELAKKHPDVFDLVYLSSKQDEEGIMTYGQAEARS